MLRGGSADGSPAVPPCRHGRLALSELHIHHRRKTMLPMIAWILSQLISIFIFVLLINIVLSWLLAFNVVNPHNRVVAMFIDFSEALTQPVLAPFRKVIPAMGGIDITPIIVFVLLRAIQGFILAPIIIKG